MLLRSIRRSFTTRASADVESGPTQAALRRDFYVLAVLDLMVGATWMVMAPPESPIYVPATSLWDVLFDHHLPFYGMKVYGALMIVLALGVIINVARRNEAHTSSAIVALIIYWAWWGAMWIASFIMYRHVSLIGALMAGRGLYFYLRLLPLVTWATKRSWGR